MSNSFDLSPVIGLHRILPPTPSLTTDSSSDRAYFKPVTGDDLANNQHRQLGDFTALWKLLETTPEVGSASPATHALGDPHTPYSTPTSLSEREQSVLRNQDSHRKPRRVVTFAPNVALAGDVTTGLTTTLDDNARNGVKAFVKHVSRPIIKPNTTPEVRKFNIIQRLMGMFPEARPTLLRLPTRPAADWSPEGVHIFIDNSNIIIGFYDHIKKLRGFSKNEAVRRPAFSFHNLSLILERGRGTAKKVLVGSSPITPVILEARELGYETNILERVEKERITGSASSSSESATGRRRKVEQAVDEICHLKILESVLDYTPSTIVLASGDGAAGEYSPGFSKVIERCLARGWAVELVAFKKTLSGFYRNKEFKKRWKDQFRFVALDAFAEDLLG